MRIGGPEMSGGDPYGVHVSDARLLGTTLEEIGRRVASGEPFLDVTITSPPYANLVDYGVDGQVGFGQTEAEYLDDCAGLFSTLFRWTRDSGSLWLVVDTYLSDENRSATRPSELRPLPFTLAALAEGAGWTLREVVIWRKDKTRPWSHRGKLRNAFEYVLLLVKSNAYKFDVDQLRSSQDLARWWVRYPERYNSSGKAPDNVWDIPIPVQGSWGRREYAHSCPLPPELVRRLILLSSDVGDVVFDPFAGVGTVPAVAEALGRKAIGTELNPLFVEHFHRHVRDEIRASIAAASESSAVGPTPQVISQLRLLKLPKAVYAKYRQSNTEGLAIQSIIVDSAEQGVDASVDAHYYFVADGVDEESRKLGEKSLIDIISRAPFTKYGIASRVSVVSRESASVLVSEGAWSIYEHGRTWQVAQTVEGADVLDVPVSHRRGKFPPVVARESVNVDLEFVNDAAADLPLGR